jgi:hypothetical protein
MMTSDFSLKRKWRIGWPIEPAGRIPIQRRVAGGRHRRFGSGGTGSNCLAGKPNPAVRRLATRTASGGMAWTTIPQITDAQQPAARFPAGAFRAKVVSSAAA